MVMVSFTTRHEKRLWTAALAVLVAIHAAAAVSGMLLESLGSTAIVGIAFAVGLGLAAVSVAGIALHRGPRLEVWVALAVTSGWLMVPVRSGVSALERTHLFEYGILAALIYAALSERREHRDRPRLPALSAILATAALGWLDEAVQELLPSRVYDIRDVAVNALAAAVAVTVVAVARSARHALDTRAGL